MLEDADGQHEAEHHRPGQLITAGVDGPADSGLP